MGRRVEVPLYPQRIISLVPSQTELLYDLGLEDEVVGLTKFCVHPEKWRKSKFVVGGTKKFNFEKIHQLAPDLIIGNKEENYQEGIFELEKKYPVWMSDIADLNGALNMISSVGGLVNKEFASDNLVSSIASSLKVERPARGTALYLIWKDPYMGAGNDTFICEMMELAGFENVLGNLKRYPELSMDEIKKLAPKHILLSSEPFPFKAVHVSELKSILPQSQVRLVDGEIFSWYGSRLLKAGKYFDEM